jgi:hypothetical protein
MAAVYSLAAAIQKVQKKPDAEVSIRDAQDFVRYCMAIVADLRFDADKLITPGGSLAFPTVRPASPAHSTP